MSEIEMNNKASYRTRKNDQILYKCTGCLKKILGLSTFIKHKRTHDNLCFICVCSSRFLSKKGLFNHVTKCSKVTSLNQSSVKKEELATGIQKEDKNEDHNTEDTSDNDSLDTQLADETIVYECAVAPLAFTSTKCEFCQFCFYSQEALNFHELMHSKPDIFLTDLSLIIVQASSSIVHRQSFDVVYHNK